MSISGIGSGLTSGLVPPSTASNIAAKSPAEEFLDYARMTPAERIRDAILKEMGITEEELENMGPEQREAMEKEIAERIKDKLQDNAEQRTGMLVDVQA